MNRLIRSCVAVLGLTGSLLVALPVTAAQAVPDGSFGTVDERIRRVDTRGAITTNGRYRHPDRGR